jgi:hypothetical protein
LLLLIVHQSFLGAENRSNKLQKDLNDFSWILAE